MKDDVGRADPGEGGSPRGLPDKDCIDAPRPRVRLEASAKGPPPDYDEPGRFRVPRGYEVDDAFDGFGGHQAADAHRQGSPFAKRSIRECGRADIRKLDRTGFDAGDLGEPSGDARLERRRQAPKQRQRDEAPDKTAPQNAEDHGAP
jgi:hypothetical protein